LLRFFEHLTDGCKEVGRDLRAMHQWRTQLEEAGYVNIQKRVLKVPIGAWPKDRRLKEAGVLEMETLRVCILLLGYCVSNMESQERLQMCIPGCGSRVDRIADRRYRITFQQSHWASLRVC
jgi:hypothetical protein